MKGGSMETINPIQSKAGIWQERIEAQACSGKSIPVFCEEHGLTASTFHYWRKKLACPADCREAMGRLRGQKSVGQFIAVTSRGPGAGLPRIHLPNGVRIELMAGLESAGVNRLILSLCGVNGAKP
jgi:hypothetical protein